MKRLTVLFLAGILLSACGEKGTSDTKSDKNQSRHAHSHGEGVGKNHGMLADFSGGDHQGTLELKLHDDKGDLELWLMDSSGKPFDLPLDATITISFDAGKSVKLRVRNKDQNEDEAENPNNRNGMTNYFIFPGETGADASWLVGKSFKDQVVVSFDKSGSQIKSGKFELTPHVH